MKTQTSILLRQYGLDKEASAADKMMGTPEDLKNLVSIVVATGVVGAGAGVFNAVKTKMHENSIKNHIIELGKSFKTDPMFSENPEKAKARLYEIARFAPHVTLNKELTKSIIKSKLNNGLTDEDKQNLVMIQTQYHKNPDVSSFMPKVASADLGEILADVVMIKEAAGVKDNMLMFGAAAAMPLLAGLIGGAVNMGMAHMKQKSLKSSLESSYMKALSLSDVDKEPLMQNREKAREAFATLARFAPQVALDPQAARSFMNKIVSYDQGIDTSTVKELSEISKNIQASREGSAFAEGFSGTSSVLGTPKILAPAFSNANTAVASSIKK